MLFCLYNSFSRFLLLHAFTNEEMKKRRRRKLKTFFDRLINTCKSILKENGIIRNESSSSLNNNNNIANVLL
jgi:hypothetical protein